MQAQQLSGEQFDEFKRYVESETLPLTEKFSFSDRDYFRNQIRYAGDEAELEHRISKLNRWLNMDIHVRQLKKDFLETLQVDPDEGIMSPRKLVLEYIKGHPFHDAEYVRRECSKAVQALLDEGVIIEKPNGTYRLVE